jgi:hypothetical protein
MPGMRKAPPGVRRERVGDDRPAVWYVVWLGEPHAGGSVIIGRSKRLGPHQLHRFFPEQPGLDSRDIKGWVEGADWLLKVHRDIPAD